MMHSSKSHYRYFQYIFFLLVAPLAHVVKRYSMRRRLNIVPPHYLGIPSQRAASSTIRQINAKKSNTLKSNIQIQTHIYMPPQHIREQRLLINMAVTLSIICLIGFGRWFFSASYSYVTIPEQQPI